MPALAWILLGLITGFIASKLVKAAGEGVLMDIVLGVAGAFVGGWVFDTFGMAGVTGMNIYSMIVAMLGAIIVLVFYHTLTGRQT
jgi:uncharacterized membrane protein YeaQ/YmgE (transglycosylase-associated protein family)